MAHLLEKDDLRLRALSEDDLPLLEAWENDAEGWLSSNTINPLSKDFIQQYITTSSRHIMETGTMSLIIERRGTSPTALGHLVLYDYTPLHCRTGIGIYIAPEHRRSGYASEGIRLACHYAFEQLRCQQVYAEILAYNIPSQRMLLALGFEHTATLPRWQWVRGDYQDLYYYQKWNE